MYCCLSKETGIYSEIEISENKILFIRYFMNILEFQHSSRALEDFNDLIKKIHEKVTKFNIKLEKVVIDYCGIKHADKSGIGAMINVYGKTRKLFNNIPIKYINISESLQKIFDLLDFDEHIYYNKIKSSEEKENCANQ